MYPVSQAFKEAIANGNPQYCLMDYGTTLFTAQDLSLEAGVHFREPFNTETDLTMGQCPCATLSYTLFNDNRNLSTFEFGKHTAYLGVRTDKHDSNAPQGAIVVKHYKTTYKFQGQSLSMNGADLGYRFIAPIKMLIAANNYLYCFQSARQALTFRLNGQGQILTEVGESHIPMTPFMQNKIQQYFNSDVVGFSRQDNVVHKYTKTDEEVIEFAPLGVFIAERPKVSNSATLSISCKDQMSLFDKELPDIDYKDKTVKTVLTLICNHVGVTLKTTEWWNSDLVFSKKPAEFKTATCRDVLSWIAEAACAYARFDRTGKLELVWFQQVDVSLDEHDYSAYQEYWYSPQVVDKLVVRDQTVSTDSVVGSGNNGYIIENNPIMRL